MRRFMIVVMTLVILLAWAVPALAAEPSSQPDLAAENARLKARIAELERKVQALEQQLSVRTLPQPFSLMPRLSPPVPRHWQPRQYNGITWYMVPLTNEGRDFTDQPPVGYVVSSTGR